MKDDSELIRDVIIAADKKLRRGGRIPTVQALLEECKKSETFKRLVRKYGGFGVRVNDDGELLIDFGGEAPHAGTVH